MVYIKDWHKDILLMGRAWVIAATADAYGVSKDAFLEAVSVVYEGSYNDLSTTPDMIRYRSRKYNQFNGFNFPAGFKELEKMTGCDIDTAFKWNLLAFKQVISLEDIADVIDRDYRAVGVMVREGHSFDVAVGAVDNDLDEALLAALVQ